MIIQNGGPWYQGVRAPFIAALLFLKWLSGSQFSGSFLELLSYRGLLD